jgi:hypothetical protein
MKVRGSPSFESDNDKEKQKEEDRLILGYDMIVRESALLTTAGGILFGFLLDISINTPEGFSSINKITLLVALYSITIAISLFVMPVLPSSSTSILRPGEV